MTLDGRRGERRIALIRTDGDQWPHSWGLAPRPLARRRRFCGPRRRRCGLAPGEQRLRPQPTRRASPAPADDGASSTATPPTTLRPAPRTPARMSAVTTSARAVPRAGPRSARATGRTGRRRQRTFRSAGEKLADARDGGTRADVVHSDTEWVVEMKWDGIRAIATVHDGTVHLDRSGRDITASTRARRPRRAGRGRRGARR